MKKSFLAKCLGVCLAASLYAMSAEAAQINTIVDTGSGMFAEPEKIYAEVDETINSWFNPTEKEFKKMTAAEQAAVLEQSGKHTLIPVGDSDAIVQIYREEKGVTVNEDSSGNSGTSIRELAMTKEDLSNLSQELGADYIMYFRVTNTVPTTSVGFMSAGQKTNVTTDFRIWNAKAGNYAFVKRYVTTGSSNSFYLGAGSASHAVKAGLEKALKQISKDKEQILATIQ